MVFVEEQMIQHLNKLLPVLIFGMNCYEGGKLEASIQKNIIESKIFIFLFIKQNF